MPVISYIIIFTLIGSVFSLIGGTILLIRQKSTLKFAHWLSAFAAGTLLGSALFELLPEAQHHAEELRIPYESVFTWVLAGILLFYLMERFIHWFHTPHTKDPDERHTIPLIVIGDSIHNIIDGVVIAVTFMASIPLGIVTTLAVAAHEIPQEIGDFAVLLKRGMNRKKVFIINLVSGLLSLLSAIITYFIGGSIEKILPYALSITAGFFIYIALSDLIPDIHQENRRGFAFIETSMLIFGIILIALLTLYVHPEH